MEGPEGKTIDTVDKTEKITACDGVGNASETLHVGKEAVSDSIEPSEKDKTTIPIVEAQNSAVESEKPTTVEESTVAEIVPSGQDNSPTVATEIRSNLAEMKTVENVESCEEASSLQDEPDTEMNSVEERGEHLTDSNQIDDNNPSVDAEQIVSSENAGSVAQIIKDEPTDAEMESAEDFTRKQSDFPTVPRINIKQEVPTSIHEQVAAERALESKAVLQINSSSLSLLSQYISSDSESNITDSDEEETRNGTNAGNKRKVSSSSSEDEVEIIPNTESYRTHDVPIIVSDAETTATGMDESSEDELSADEEEVAQQKRPPIKSKGEVLINELPPIEDLQISVPERECKPIGHVESIVAQIVIVQSYAGVELLDLETVLFLEKGKRALGKIFDVIGQVTAPMYCVLFNNRNDVIRKGISVGMPVYCAPQTEHTSFIILSDLMKHRGSDASWLDDNEAPDHVLDYSDDEQERRARRRRGSCSSSGRVSPEMQYQPYQLPTHHHRRGHGRRGGGGAYRSRGRGHSWHNNIPHQPAAQPQRVLNPFAFVAGVPPPPPPPPPAPPGSGN
ncbi:H/ACA ribonucleoprotein complex non-core subunit NAF1 [Aedes aegypti]|uniref:H/ACA ribonucleoprotein complex non-core subunit NAF1 n=1 Tax=Aedes aegypti TaxID=7159 RepID=A0A1S4F2Z2_AEDAE|nr:H/ACA ribonucleoprotein complex non-core subunit NAF1 [Aedes aegypti]